MESYERSLATAVRLGDRQIAEELEWRAAFMKRFPSWSFNMSALTVRNTHGDYFISQFLCEEDRLSSIIDWTTACTHPVIWEIMRSFVYGAPCCARGEIDSQLLERYIAAYCRCGALNDYDRENLYRLYLYTRSPSAITTDSITPPTRPIGRFFSSRRSLPQSS